ncbi:MAG: ribonucleoside-diphosphate reductase, adenosylcobalamin-dependent, partial [Pseudomonadota bacterium]
MSSVRLEAVPNGVSDIAFQPASVDIWDKKYRLKSKTGEEIDASIDETYKRVAKALSDVESGEEKRAYWNERFLWALPGGGVLTAWIVGKTDRFAAAATIKPVINWLTMA